MAPIKIGIIGGTGMNEIELFKIIEEKKVKTPFGEPSGSLIVGSLDGVACVLLNRHGSGHRIQPSDVNYRANVWAMKQEGCTHLLVTTACGSLQEKYKPGDIVILDDFIDRTTKRRLTFYDGTSPDHVGVSHVPMNEPFCPKLRAAVASTIKSLGFPHHIGGTMITIEGPRFSTRAESKLWRQWNADVVNMSTVPEVTLAKEAGLLYGSMALVTDYDCWRDDHAAVNVDDVMVRMKELRDKAIQIITAAVKEISQQDWTKSIEDCRETARSSCM